MASGKITMTAERRSDAQKGGKRDAPHDWRVWIKDLEQRLDVAWDRRIQEWRESVAKTEELDVEDILDEIDEDEIEDADELDAEDDPTVKAPKKSRKARKSSKSKKSTKAKGEGGIGTSELAEAAGTDARALRVLLRAEFPREEGGRYVWKSLNDPEAKAIIKRVRSGAVKDAQSEKLSKLKKGKSKKTSAKAKKSTKKSGKKLTKAERAKARRAKAKAEADEE